MNQRLKKIIFKKLYEDLKNVEIIPYMDSIWFIDRENKYWYFQYEKDGTLWWKFDFFNVFFRMFSLQRKEYESVISDWVEDVLNCKVYTTGDWHGAKSIKVEDVLNCKVYTTNPNWSVETRLVEDVLNCKVYTTLVTLEERFQLLLVEDVLNCKVYTTDETRFPVMNEVEDVLNCKVDTTMTHRTIFLEEVEKVLNLKSNP
jgi:hypothetical protein